MKTGYDTKYLITIIKLIAGSGEYIRKPNSTLSRRADVNDLTGFQRDLLYVIAELEDPHGLALKDDLKDYYEKEVNHERLYPNLDTLVNKGLVKKGQLDYRTNIYTLTDYGKRELEARRNWENQYLSEVLKIPAED